MAITRVSKLLSVGVTLALLAPHVLGQGGGEGGGGGGGGGPPTGSTSNSTSATSTTPPLPDATTTTSDSTSVPTPPPLPDATMSASGSTSASTITATSLRTSDTSRAPPPDTSGDATPPPLGVSDDGSLPPPDTSGNSTGPPDQGGSEGGDNSTEIYFPSEYTAECDHLGEDAHYAVKITDGVRQAWSDTGCSNQVNWGVDKGPDYHFPGRITPSNASIPAYPMLIGGNGTTDLSETNGQVAILVNGVAMFSAWATEPVTDYESTAFYLEGDTLDACGGHATTEGWYHYHGTPGCLEEQVMKGEGLTMHDHSPFLGWSYDGFPMYGHLGPDGIEMKACDTDGADETYCLDTCSGYEGEIEGIDDFKYRYYLTCGYDESFFPMTINCFRGCCPVDMECDAVVEVCDDTAEDGFTLIYEPEVGYNYTSMYELEMLSGDDSEYINSSTGPNCTMFYNETLTYTVQQISIEDFPNGTTPSPSPSDHATGETEAPTSSRGVSHDSTPSSISSSETPVSSSTSPPTPSKSQTPTVGVAWTTAFPTTADGAMSDTAAPTAAPTSPVGSLLTPSRGRTKDHSSPTSADGAMSDTAAPTAAPTPPVGSLLTPLRGRTKDHSSPTSADGAMSDTAAPTAAPTSPVGSLLTPLRGRTKDHSSPTSADGAMSDTAAPTAAPTSPVGSLLTSLRGRTNDHPSPTTADGNTNGTPAAPFTARYHHGRSG